jgi:hypothetical protein
MSAIPMPGSEPFDENFQWDLTLDFSSANDDYELDLMLPIDAPLEDQLALDSLLDEGFTWEEGLRLLILRSNLYEVPEMAERITQDPHMEFARWLYQHGILTS